MKEKNQVDRYSFRDDWRKGNRKELEISRKQIGMEKKNKRFRMQQQPNIIT